MRERLIAIFNEMHRIETHGESTLMMADCIRELASIINLMPDEKLESEAEE